MRGTVHLTLGHGDPWLWALLNGLQNYSHGVGARSGLEQLSWGEG